MEQLSRKFGEFCMKNGLKVTTAESCTAGLVSATIAMTPGSSTWLDRGFVVYTPEAKNEMLGVNLSTIKEFDITSEEVAKEMVVGSLERADANLAMAVTGVAGPGGGSAKIPVGTICMAWAFRRNYLKVYSETKVFSGTRNEIREAVVKYMLEKSMTL